MHLHFVPCRCQAGIAKIDQYFMNDMNLSMLGEQDKARDKAALQQAFMEHSIDGIVIMDVDTAGVIDANSAFARMLGYTLEEVCRLYVWDWDANWSESQLREMFVGRSWPDQRFDTRHRCKDGKIVDVDVSVTGILWQGKPVIFCVVRDISELTRQQLRLQEEVNRWQLLMQRSREGIVILDASDISVIDVNPAFADMLGYEPETMKGMHPWDWDACYNRADIEAGTSTLSERAEEHLLETCMRCQDGTLREAEISSTYMVISDRPQIICICRDVTARNKAARLLRAREQEFRSLAENAPDAIVRYSQQLRRLYVNPVLESLLGKDRNELIGQLFQTAGSHDLEIYQTALENVFKTGARQEAEVRHFLADGSMGWFHARCEPEFAEDGTVKSVLAIIRDISDVVEQRELAQHLAYTDTLTGLPNRARFEKRFQEAAARSERSGKPFALFMLDLDHFKDINDSLGHNSGDELLRQVTARLSSCIRDCDTIARMGGDEFAILQTHIHTSKEADEVASELLNELSRPFFIDSQELFISGSIGIAFYPDDSGGLRELFTFADTAMYSAKRMGRNNFQFYVPELTRCAAERLSLGAALRYACANQELRLHYQPKVLLEGGRIVGAEALLRWCHPDLGMLAPDRFICIAEETGLIIDIGRWVLETACKAAIQFNRNSRLPFKVAVNLSYRQFVRHDLVAEVESILHRTGCRGEWLELEITESLMVEDNLLVRRSLDALRSLGITIAIDDFGTGFSALNYLSRFPMDVLKIDRSFIDGMADDARKAGLVQAFISIGKALAMDIVAEGVETAVQVAALQKWGCDKGQGTFFGRPQPFSALLAVMQASGQ